MIMEDPRAERSARMTAPPHPLDHVVVAAPELSAGVEHVRQLTGLRALPGGRHPSWGTWNAVIPLRHGAYLEVIAPDPRRPAAQDVPLFGLARLEAPRLVTWAARTLDPDGARRVAAAHDLDLGGVSAGERARADGTTLRWRLTDPGAGRAGGVIPFFIDWGNTPHPSASAAPQGEILELRASHPAPDRLRRLVSALGLSLALVTGPEPGLTAVLETPRGRVELG